MKIRIITIPALLFVVLLGIAGCSGNDSREEKQSALDKAIENTAKTATDYVKTPIDRAKNVQDVGETRNKTLEEYAKED